MLTLASVLLFVHVVVYLALPLYVHLVVSATIAHLMFLAKLYDRYGRWCMFSILVLGNIQNFLLNFGSPWYLGGSFETLERHQCWTCTCSAYCKHKQCCKHSLIFDISCSLEFHIFSGWDLSAMLWFVPWLSWRICYNQLSAINTLCTFDCGFNS